MPNFANPFQGNVDRKMTKEELIQAVRLDIAGELEAIYLYESHVLATDNAAAKKVIADIRDEEKAHIGELMSLLKILDPEEAKHFADGETEVAEMMEELNIQIPEVKEKPSQDKSAHKTVGSLIKD
ncbi:demethoxyubiquinone hydroxylase family protein [Clostridium sp. MT-14]|jgi:rubrerythrin|uniref:Demethoxyubiquinone hydroxylase family protein n=1 Tax=Clostridium aromativorans TaxID=2836848 RepID=A0ABS8N5A6_9CLOT|nr:MULTISPECIES: demethoxyubiquinone hydroxylase family protein [Clostridium]KAA8675374.1 ubiquinone biosynthesis protein COQ7 [Clostridium sp. HV4-5-A1G]MCC9293943.1 demethoxyubiquinone hydroxylase family protein [Clostridium aromativorans]CAB1241776.1 2-nonaprenyl-3-methyl-6-methoxy-1,4-benzoquinol hydroxylase [Clostridiaceae bacterium BL-3]